MAKSMVQSMAKSMAQRHLFLFGVVFASLLLFGCVQQGREAAPATPAPALSPEATASPTPTPLPSPSPTPTPTPTAVVRQAKECSGFQAFDCLSYNTTATRTVFVLKNKLLATIHLNPAYCGLPGCRCAYGVILSPGVKTTLACVHLNIGLPGTSLNATWLRVTYTNLLNDMDYIDEGYFIPVVEAG